MPGENNQSRDLAAELAQATAFKEPSKDVTPTWDWDAGAGPENRSGADTNITPADKTESTGGGKLSADKIRVDSRASAAAVEFITSLMSEAIISIRYAIKIPAEDRERLEEKIRDTPDHNLTQKELLLKRKDERHKKDRDRKLASVKTSDLARKRMEEAFAAYSEATGETFMSPKTQIGVAIGEAVIKSALAAFID